MPGIQRGNDGVGAADNVLSAVLVEKQDKVSTHCAIQPKYIGLGS